MVSLRGRMHSVIPVGGIATVMRSGWGGQDRWMGLVSRDGMSCWVWRGPSLGKTKFQVQRRHTATAKARSRARARAKETSVLRANLKTRPVLARLSSTWPQPSKPLKRQSRLCAVSEVSGVSCAVHYTKGNTNDFVCMYLCTYIHTTPYFLCTTE